MAREEFVLTLLMVFGAGAPQVLRMMLRQGFMVIGAGLMIGLAGAIASTRALDPMLFGVEPTDPATWVTVAALLGSVALFACYMPARQATRVDPVDSLRSE